MLLSKEKYFRIVVTNQSPSGRTRIFFKRSSTSEDFNYALIREKKTSYPFFLTSGMCMKHRRPPVYGIVVNLSRGKDGSGVTLTSQFHLMSDQGCLYLCIHCPRTPLCFASGKFNLIFFHGSTTPSGPGRPHF